MLFEFDTEDVRDRDQFDRWAAFGAESLVPVVMRPEDRGGGFRASTRVLAVGDVRISEMAHPSVRVRRPPALIRRSDPEVYQLVFIAEGDCVVGQADREAGIGAGQFTLLDTSRPLEGRRACCPDVSSVLVQVPRTRVTLPPSLVAPLVATPFAAGHGMGAVLRRWLVGVLSQARDLGPEDGPALASVTADLVSATLAAPLRAEDALTPRARRRALRLRVDGFIDSRLGDPGLTPAVVAAAHHVSLRSLQQLFAADGAGPAATIRHRRLERCHRDLADPALRQRPVHAVAARWGFTDHAHFCRLFRAAYGMSPTEHRHERPREPANPLRERATRSSAGVGRLERKPNGSDPGRNAVRGRP